MPTGVGSSGPRSSTPSRCHPLPVRNVPPWWVVFGIFRWICTVSAHERIGWCQSSVLLSHLLVLNPVLQTVSEPVVPGQLGSVHRLDLRRVPGTHVDFLSKSEAIWRWGRNSDPEFRQSPECGQSFEIFPTLVAPSLPGLIGRRQESLQDCRTVHHNVVFVDGLQQVGLLVEVERVLHDAFDQAPHAVYP